MYLRLKSNLQPKEEITVGFDIRKLSDENIGIELGYYTLELPENTNINKAEYQFGVHHLKDTFTIGQKFPPLPELDKGYYEFIVYKKTKDDKRIVLDTYTFEVVD